MSLDFVPPHETAEPETRRPSWSRLIVAWAITFAALPYLWGRTLIWPLLVGQPDWRFASLTAAVVLGLMALTWTARPPAGGLGVFLGWLLANSILIAFYAVPRMELWELLLVFVMSTIWVVWLAWFGAWPLSLTLRVALLGVWLGLGMMGPWLIRVEGMMGDTGLVFAWRFDKRAGLANADTVKATVAAKVDLVPTREDFPQYLGPDRNGVLPNTKIAGDWTKNKPRQRWRRPIGSGWSSFAIVGGYAFTQEQRGDRECVTCYRVTDSAPMWIHEDDARFEGLGGVGPSATPTVADGRVYSIGGTGILNCLNAVTGEPIWTVNILKDNDVTRIAAHGTCASPLVDGDRVLVCPTGAGGPCLAAYHRETGSRLWTAGTDQASYSSPVIAEISGIRQILLATSVGVKGFAEDGKSLWSFPWTNNEGINASQPIPISGAKPSLFLSTGYGKGAVRFGVRIGNGPEDWVTDEPMWTSMHMKTKFTTPVLHNGFVYGLDEGILACVDLSTGQRKWKDGRYGHGQVLLAGDRLIVQVENGEVVLVEPSPEKLIEHGRIKALSSKTWNNPALAGRFLLVRNDSEAVCYELPARGN